MTGLFVELLRSAYSKISVELRYDWVLTTQNSLFSVMRLSSPPPGHWWRDVVACVGCLHGFRCIESLGRGQVMGCDTSVEAPRVFECKGFVFVSFVRRGFVRGLSFELRYGLTQHVTPVSHYSAWCRVFL